jgi:hypothetical protein
MITIRSAVLGWMALCLCAASGCADDSKTCLDYACFKSTNFSGSIPLTQEVTFVDVELCFEGDCHSGLIDTTAADSGTACANWTLETYVCLQPAARADAGEDAGSHAWTVDASWNHDQLASPPPDGSRYTLRITDHATGVEMLDVTRRAHYVHPPQQDDCHDDCFQAELEL